MADRKPRNPRRIRSRKGPASPAGKEFRPKTRAKTTRKAGRPAAVSPESEADSPQGVRLQKILALAGHGSRRQCEDLIVSGRVEIDRQVVTELGVRADPARQEIRVDGEPLSRTRLAYFVAYKPVGVVTTNRDPAGRPRVIDLLPPMRERMFAVGRLDLHSHGLIVLTNDGALANHLTHPRYGVPKTYEVLVAGQLTPADVGRIKSGANLAEGFVRPASAEVLAARKQSTLLEIVLREGKNREIRRLLARVGHKALDLKRVAIGGIRLADLEPGESRRLRADEVERLWQSAGRKPAPRRTK